MSDRSPYSRTPLYVDLGGLAVEVAYAPAAEWVNAVSSGAGALPLLTMLTDRPTGDRIVHGLIDGRYALREVQEAAYALLTEATPYTWWKSARLLSVARQDDVAGHLTLAGVDLWSVTPAQLVAAVYTLLVKGLDAPKKFRVDAELDNPPPGVVDDAWMSDADFAALVAQARNAPGQG